MRNDQDPIQSINDPETHRKIMEAIIAKRPEYIEVLKNHPELLSIQWAPEKANVFARIANFFRKIFGRKSAEQSFLDLLENASRRSVGGSGLSDSVYKSSAPSSSSSSSPIGR